MHEKSSGATIAMICGTYVLLQILFIDKAVHVDDTLFLWAAENILRHPLDFYEFSLNWYGFEMEMSRVMQNPPLVSYYLAAVMWLGGRSEVALHLAMLVPGVLAVLGVQRLASQYVRRGWLATLLAVLSPPFLIAGASFMADMPLLAFWVWAVHLYSRGEREERSGLRLAGAVCATGAILCKYNGLAIVPLLLAVGLWRHRGLRWHMAVLLLPLGAALAYHLWTQELYGAGLLASAMTYSLQVGEGLALHVAQQAMLGLCFLGGCLAGCFLFAPMVWGRWGLALLLASALAGGLFIGLTQAFGVADLSGLAPGVHWLVALQAGLFMAAGLHVLFVAGAELRRGLDVESLLLVLWFGGQFLFAVFVNWTVNARAILPLVPPACLLLVRALERQRAGQRRPLVSLAGASPAAVALGLLLAGALGVAVAWCDAKWANAGREAAARLEQRLERPAATVHFMGHWGFQYYMERRAFIPLDHRATMLPPGGMVVVPLNMLQRSLDLQPFRKILDISLPGCGFLATKHENLLAGFHSSVYGPLPYVFAPTREHRFQVYAAMRPVIFARAQ